MCMVPGRPYGVELVSCGALGPEWVMQILASGWGSKLLEAVMQFLALAAATGEGAGEVAGLRGTL